MILKTILNQFSDIEINQSAKTCNFFLFLVNAHRRIARVIYDKHISDACGEPVNLPQTESRIILKALESELPLTRFLFDDAAEV